MHLPEGSKEVCMLKSNQEKKKYIIAYKAKPKPWTVFPHYSSVLYAAWFLYMRPVRVPLYV